MFDEPDNEEPVERVSDPTARAAEKAGEIRMHAELAAIFEGPRKFEAQLLTNLDATIARDIQRGVGKLEKAKIPESPIVAPTSVGEALALLTMPQTSGLSTNDYHIHRRPGEVMIVRWLTGDEVATFYERIQAHFDAALNGFRNEERTSNEWKQEPQTIAYLDALDKIEEQMADRYLRDLIKDQKFFVLSTQTADEINIVFLCEHLMGAAVAEVVGTQQAPPDSASDSDLAWFFKLFALRGVTEENGELVERICFFTYLQKSDDSFDF